MIGATLAPSRHMTTARIKLGASAAASSLVRTVLLTAFSSTVVIVAVAVATERVRSDLRAMARAGLDPESRAAAERIHRRLLTPR